MNSLTARLRFGWAEKARERTRHRRQAESSQFRR